MLELGFFAYLYSSDGKQNFLPGFVLKMKRKNVSNKVTPRDKNALRVIFSISITRESIL